MQRWDHGLMLTGEKVRLVGAPQCRHSSRVNVLMLLMFTYFDVVSTASSRNIRHRGRVCRYNEASMQSVMFINCFSSLRSNLDFNRILSCQHFVFSHQSENTNIKTDWRNYHPNISETFCNARTVKSWEVRSHNLTVQFHNLSEHYI